MDLPRVYGEALLQEETKWTEPVQKAAGATAPGTLREATGGGNRVPERRRDPQPVRSACSRISTLRSPESLRCSTTVSPGLTSTSTDCSSVRMSGTPSR